MDPDLAEHYEQHFHRELTEPLTKSGACDILYCIRRRNGYLDKDEDAELRNSSDPRDQRLRLALLIIRKNLARYTKAVSDQLYDHSFRTFFELLQNADDSYKATTGTEFQPCIKFTIHQRELFVDTRDDGFRLENVLAICSTGESSKRGSEESIGCKGFGFKSVFGIASTAHIQSELWSFTFKHNRNEDGIGMVSPIEEPQRELPEGIRTRITLTFHNESGGDTASQLYNWIESLPVSIIGFLKNIRRVEVEFLSADNYVRRILFERPVSQTQGLHELNATVNGTKKVHSFRELSRIITDTSAPTDHADTAAKITVRFPISDHQRCTPLVDPEGQYVFAYLPMRQIPQLPFIIQANFSVTASRQDVPDDRWNQKLKQHTATLFADAVETFVTEEKSDLRFQWLTYLPARVQPIPGFWNDLLSRIKEELLDRNIFISHDNVLRKANELRLLPSTFLHNGQPILRAPTNRTYAYLSEHYQNSDANVLQDLGVQELSLEDILEEIEDDCRSESSRLRFPLDNPWHDAYANLLESLMQSGDNQRRKETATFLRGCPIFPVRRRNGVEWKTLEEPIYFPVLIHQRLHSQNDFNEVKILMPTDLGFPVLHPEAAKSLINQRMYRNLGIKDCSSEQLCGAIFKVQQQACYRKIKNYVAHFELLFWFECPIPPEQKLLAASVNPRGFRPSNQLFFRTTEPYSIANLVQLSENSDYKEYFLNERYSNSGVSSWKRGNKTWLEWLEDVAGVRRYPSLDSPDCPGQLHPLVVAVRDKNPKSFLTMIQEHWTQAYSAACSSSEIKHALLQSLVPCRRRNPAKLRDTWFPSTEIINEARNFSVETTLPILWLPESTEGCDISRWTALRELGIQIHTDVAFYQKVLISMTKQSKIQEDKICELYAQIGRLASLDQMDNLEEFFSSRALVWKPTSKEWIQISQCVWDSEVPLSCLFAIASTYSEDSVKHLFKTLLKLKDATYQSLIAELEAMRKDTTESNTLSRLSDIYTALYNMVNDDEEARMHIRSRFQKHRLIYHEGAWLPPSQCIWSSSVNIKEYIGIEGTYPTLRKLFVGVLQVQTVTTDFMLQELAKAAANPDEAIRHLMLETGKTIPQKYEIERFRQSIEVLKIAKFMPCTSPRGGLTYLSLTNSFFIADNENLANAFARSLYIVDFSYQELTTLHGLFKLLGLEGRYLSANVVLSTEEGDKKSNDELTQQFRDCAYALSCCAVFYRSPLYSHESQDMHERLRTTLVYTSSNMRTEYRVKDDGKWVQVIASKAFLTIKIEKDCTRIVLPEDTAERKSCLRSQLPKALAKALRIDKTGAERQIYRLINERDLGTDQILAAEDIPHVDKWLAKTQRLPKSDDGSFPEGEEFVDTEVGILPEQIDLRRSQVIISSPPTEYKRVLEHLRRAAAAVLWRDNLSESALVSTHSHASFFKNLTSERAGSTDSRCYPELFGRDEYLKDRVGAAGEFFTFELLRTLTGGRIQVDNWKSTIRHHVKVHQDYSKISAWSGRETADIVYDAIGELYEVTDLEDDCLRLRFQKQIIGDAFEGWLPQWMGDECTCFSDIDQSSVDDQQTHLSDDDGSNEHQLISIDSDAISIDDDQSSTSDSSYTPSLSSSAMDASQGLCETCREQLSEPYEWLFEVKTTLGPCETPFFISPKQYELMRATNTVDGRDRRQVYCIVRIYDLLKERVGVRIFIDPWRFRDGQLQFTPTSTTLVRVT